MFLLEIYGSLIAILHLILLHNLSFLWHFLNKEEVRSRHTNCRYEAGVFSQGFAVHDNGQKKKKLPQGRLLVRKPTSIYLAQTISIFFFA